ncbi:MAG: aminotransferase class III-fold pyridoxal phosphate-dependent enzyme, partial [Acidobacteriota bacterium]
EHEQIPAHLHLNRLNPLISLGENLAIPTELTPWLRGAGPRIAGVSSFGFGGTNAHVILEEPPSPPAKRPEVDRPAHLLALSARSASALGDLSRRYGDHLSSSLTDAAAADVCFTANTGRSHFKHRVALRADSTADLREQLSKGVPATSAQGIIHPPKIAFLFTGQGALSAGVGRELYRSQPTFRRALDDCDEILAPLLSGSLVSALYSEDGDSPLLRDAAYTQCALFAVEHALGTLWRSWGVEPDFVLGHSLGEYAAAHFAGCFDLEDGLRLVAERGRLMQALPSADAEDQAQRGSMLAVFADPDRVAASIAPHPDEASIAVVNGPGHVVVSGAHGVLADLADRFDAENVATQRLDVSHAFHSPLVEPMLASFEEVAGRIPFRAPHIPWVSNVTGRLFDPDSAPDAAYWRQQTRGTVHFSEGLATLAAEGVGLFVELGPRPVLLGLGKRCLAQPRPGGPSAAPSEIQWIPSLVPGNDDWSTLLAGVGRAYESGVDIDWKGFDRDYERRKLALPTYPFQRQRYWVGDPIDAAKPEVHPMSKASSAIPSATVAHAAAPSPGLDRPAAIFPTLRTWVAELLREHPARIEPHTPFLELGADSIAFLDIARRIEQTYGVKVSIRSFFEALKTPELVVAYIDENLPADWSPPVEVSAVEEAQPPQPVPTERTERPRGTEAVAETSGMAQVVMRQLDLMQQQLELLQPGEAPATAAVRQTVANAPVPVEPVPVEPVPVEKAQPPAVATTKPAPALAVEPQELSSTQASYLDTLTMRYVGRTRKSRQRAVDHRKTWADLRSVWGFRPEVKELCYPIVATRSEGSRFEDVDGNEYVDIAMGFGSNMFGHNAPFLMEALRKQLDLGIQVGPQSDLAGDVAALVCKLTGMERATFCNSGTEAVMAAIRAVRAHRGRTKIVTFTGSYHGHSDGTLAVARQVAGESSSIPMAPGVPQTIADDVLVLPYGDPSSLDEIRRHADELAAVLVEPVQSRQPHIQPRDFLRELRSITEAAGVALLFDEVITGFRCHPGGAQALFGIEADLATYGKVVGGGMPIGVVAGKAAYLDRVD